MARASDKRERLIEAAKDLFYRQGVNATTLADVAQASGVPLGNVYYYFKTRDDLAAAAIDGRDADICNLLDDCCHGQCDGRSRLLRMLDTLAARADLLAERGCPIGSLCQELGRTSPHLAGKAERILTRMVDWCEQQFREMGRPDARSLAIQMAADLQGISLVGHALRDPGVIREQAGRMRAWVERL